MKNFYLASVASLIFSGAYAQSLSLPSKNNKAVIKTQCIRNAEYVESKGSTSNEKAGLSFKKETAVDTAGIEYMQDKLTAYSTTGNLACFGTNEYGNKELVQIYPYWGSGFNVEKVLILFWAKLQAANPGSLSVKIYNVSFGNPGTVLATKSLSMTNVDTVGLNFTVVDLAAPVAVTGSFGAGIDVSGLISGTSWTDLVGVMTTTEGEPHGTANLRIKANNNSWTPVSVWTGLTDVNLIILPVVSGAYDTGINETQEINGIKLTTYPNPTADFAKIEYQIKDAANVSLDLIDATGKRVLTQNEGKQVAGNHQIVLNVSQLPAGNYFYSLTAGDKRLTKQMTVK